MDDVVLGDGVGVSVVALSSSDGAGDECDIASLWAALNLRARSKRIGNVVPRFAARLSIPVQAFGLKKNLWGTWGSKISDNEHPTAPLWDSEVLRVKHPPRHAIPEFFDALEDQLEIVAVV